MPHLFSFSIMLWVGDEPLCSALLLPWWVFVRRMVDMKLVSQAPVADDIPKRWCGCCSGLQHKYRWKCCRNTPDTQYNATGFTHELRKLSNIDQQRNEKRNMTTESVSERTRENHTSAKRMSFMKNGMCEHECVWMCGVYVSSDRFSCAHCSV